jgi:hypothetical protein
MTVTSPAKGVSFKIFASSVPQKRNWSVWELGEHLRTSEMIHESNNGTWEIEEMAEVEEAADSEME